MVQIWRTAPPTVTRPSSDSATKPRHSQSSQKCGDQFPCNRNNATKRHQSTGQQHKSDRQAGSNARRCGHLHGQPEQQNESGHLQDLPEVEVQLRERRLQNDGFEATLIVVGLISDGRRQNCRKQHQLHGVRDPSRIRTRLDSIVHKPVHQTSSQILNGSIGRRRMSTNGQLYSTIQDGHTGQDQTR